MSRFSFWDGPRSRLNSAPEYRLAIGHRPPEDMDLIWYRGWECSHDTESAAWTGRGFYACLGGQDLDCITVTASTWADLLDEIDEHDLTEAVA